MKEGPDRGYVRKAQRRGADGSHTAAEWQARLEEFDYRCAYCGRKGGRLTRDHVVPLSRGGSDSIKNIVPACRKCNGRKRDLTLDEWMSNDGSKPGLGGPPQCRTP